jgi:membrane protease YdiL (CAAX protease family)
MIKSFGQAIVADNISIPQLLFFLAVLPGIFEEIAFRGLLLHGLRKRFRPAVRVIVVGLLFGFYHVALFRLAPTAFLGILLACVTLLSGSIYPAMLWHVLNNSLAILGSDWQMAITELDGPYFLAGPVLLGCAFWIFWRERFRPSDERKDGTLGETSMPEFNAKTQRREGAKKK